jgi:hypothetical protein
MTRSFIAGAGRLAAALLLAGGCATASYARLEPPAGTRALGLPFGEPRDSVESALRDAEIPFTDVPGDPDAVLASRCPRAPARTGCRLQFGPRGLYAAQLEAPVADAGRLVSAVEAALGKPDPRAGADSTPGDGAPLVLASWGRAGWTVGVSQLSVPGAGGSALLRVELDSAAPPVVAGVGLGRRRADVERALQLQGAVVVQRDDEATTYLGCPQGDAGAVTCVVTFEADRAASITEIHPTPADDVGALAAWNVFAGRLAAEIGRQPQTSCPPSGPERATGDCTASWGSDRLLIVVGAHRNAGGQHRGAISVYTAWSYPRLAPEGGAAPEE